MFKKIKGFTLVELLLVCAIVALLVGVLPARAEDSGRPVEIALTLPGGATNVVSTNFSGAVKRDVASSLKLQAVEYALTGSAATNVGSGTLTLKRSGSGVAYFSATVATNAMSAVAFESNNWYWLSADSVVVSCSLTNAGTVRLICNER